MLLLILKKEEKKMVKIRRRDTERARLAVKVLEREKEKVNGTYNLPEVNDALREMFFGKCYICENKHLISYQVEHFRPVKGDINRKFEPLDQEPETLETVELLCKVHEGTTWQKKMEATDLKRALRKELSQFKETVREYQEAEGEDKEDYLCLIQMQLKPNSPFTAFKRWLIRDNAKRYPELMEFCE